MQHTSFAHGYIPLARLGCPSITTDDMKRQRVCFRCKKPYREIDNIGSWQCLEHTQSFDANRRIYPCCDSTRTGCVVCDHADDPVTPYPGSISDAAISNGIPVYKLRVGNLKELGGAHQEALQLPADFEQQKREHGDELAPVYIYRRCKFGVPDDAQGISLR